MSRYSKDVTIGALGWIVGLVGIGYAVGTHTKLAKISERLDKSIDDLADNTEIDIPEELINKAIEKAVAIEAKKAVTAAANDALNSIKRDIHNSVSETINCEYEHIKESVLKEVTVAASKIDVNRVRRDVEAAAKKAALEKFDSNMDDILEQFNENLSNLSKIYNSMAGIATKNIDSGKEFVFKVG